MMNYLAPEYEKDFYAWLQQNARLLREGKFTEIDGVNLAEELEALGRSEKRQFINRLAVLLAHLLKWVYQPGKRSHSWRCTIEEQRERLAQLLKDSPSLKQQIDETLAAAYAIAIPQAAKETGLKSSIFPQNCPFSLDQALDKQFYPD